VEDPYQKTFFPSKFTNKKSLTPEKAIAKGSHTPWETLGQKRKLESGENMCPLH